MAPRRHLTRRVTAVAVHLVVVAAAFATLIPGTLGCSSPASTGSTSVYNPVVRSLDTEEQSREEKRAIAVARDYLRARGAETPNDSYAASPYRGGWRVQIRGGAGSDFQGNPNFNPGLTRFVGINADWKVVDYIPGAGPRY